MHIEFEVRAFGKEDAPGTVDACKSSEHMRAYDLSNSTTLAELETILMEMFGEVESGYANLEQCLGKVTIRAKRDIT